jgi:hypothetical protein
MDFLYKKSATKINEEYVIMTGKTMADIENDVKNLKAKLFPDGKVKKWSTELGSKIIEEVST